MPVSYQFINNKTKKPVLLNKLDTLVCRLIGEPCQPRTWSTPMFDAIHIAGFRAAYHTGHATKEGFEERRVT